MEKKLPYVALALSDEDFDSKLQEAFYRGIDIIEFRVDLLENLEIDYIRKHLRKIKEKDIDVILTIRAKWEGGGHEIDDNYRFNIYKECIDLVDYLDIELSSNNLLGDIVELGNKNKKNVIISFHDFEKTPSEEVLQGLIDKCFKYGADISKIATKVNTEDDVAKLLSISYKNKKLGRRLITIGMGELGKITRVAGYFFGSIITYTYIGKSVAPGQIEINKLFEELRFYGIK
ncbi:MAG: type I 3-dehydroquinate dehydratase [Persephonella sp.]|nr:MAG: type I 3-dehydroquinate dehydratase [Persephonella sp.]